MNLVADFRDPKKAAGLIDTIAKAARSDKTYRFMEFLSLIHISEPTRRS